MPVIETSGLTKVYRTYRKERGLWGSIKGLGKRRYDETRAADQVSFNIEEGEFVGFLGPNGAGKTTVLKMLSGLLNPTSGDARVLGFVPWERRNEMKRQFSLLMGQKNALWWDLPAQESLELNRAIYGIDHVRFKKVVDGLSELLEVQDKMNVMVRELSLGERMKMELISALIHEPRVLFLDEPTIGLDVVSQKRVREFLRVYNEKHHIVTLLTSHYMQDIQELCHRVLVIDHGKIFFDGPLDEIVDRFSGYKILSLTFEKEAARDLSAFGEITEQTPVSVQLKVPRAKVTETCRELLEACDVSDINVQEVPVEEVIRQLLANAARIFARLILQPQKPPELPEVSSKLNRRKRLRNRVAMTSLADRFEQRKVNQLPMRSCNRLIGFALLPLAFLSCNDSRGPKSDEDSKQQLLALENRWLQVEDDPVALESILAPDFLHVVPGEIITKEQQLQFLRQRPASSQHPEKHFEDLHVRVYGEAGIVNGAVIETSEHGQRKTLFTDVFVQRDGKWHAVSAQELPVTGP